MNRPLRELSKGVRDEARRSEEDRGHDAVMNTECDRERTFPGQELWTRCKVPHTRWKGVRLARKGVHQKASDACCQTQSGVKLDVSEEMMNQFTRQAGNVGQYTP